MDNPNGSPTAGDSGGGSPEEAVTERQLKHVLDHLQLQLKGLSYDTLNGNQKINLLAIRTLGIVYGLVAVVHLAGVILTPGFTFAEASTNLQTTLVLFAAFYGLIMLLSEIASKAVGPEPPSTDDLDVQAGED